MSIGEQIIRDMLICGYSMEKIGKDMDWPLKTVKTYCSSVYSKLGFKSQRDLLDNGPALFSGDNEYKRMFADHWYWIPGKQDKREKVKEKRESTDYTDGKVSSEK